MAPYISSDPCDSVWLVPLCPGTHWDILKNLVANTRSQQSVATQAGGRGSLVGPTLSPLVVDHDQLRGRPAPSPNGQCERWLTQAGIPTGLDLPFWQSGGFVPHRLITGTSDLSAWTVRQWLTVAVTGNGESGFDSGEGA